MISLACDDDTVRDTIYVGDTVVHHNIDCPRCKGTIELLLDTVFVIPDDTLLRDSSKIIDKKPDREVDSVKNKKFEGSKHKEHHSAVRRKPQLSKIVGTKQ